MSPSGVTTYTAAPLSSSAATAGGSSSSSSRPEFMSLAQWQREHQLHTRLMQLTVFRQHRCVSVCCVVWVPRWHYGVAVRLCNWAEA